MEEHVSPASTRPTEIQPPSLRDPMTVVEGSVSGAPPYTRMRSPTLRDVLSVLFRHRALIVLCFLIVSIGTGVAVFTTPRRYESRMKILVKRERVQMVLTPEPGTQAGNIPDVTQEDINSEVELLKSRDLLEKVVVECGLDKPDGRLGAMGWLKKTLGLKAASSLAIPLAVARLENDLDIQPIPKSHLIDIGYKATDPRVAAHVLEKLTAAYLEKHLSVHNPPGILDFFQQQTDQYRKKLQSIEEQLAKFGEKEKIVSIDLEKDLTLRSLNDFQARLHDNEASVASLDQRIDSLKAQLAATPDRVTAQVRTSDDPLLLQQLKTTLLNLELKRTELLTMYEPGYRTVQEVEAQIAQTREALAREEKKSLRDETTDLNRTHLWLDEELARASAERATMKARSEAIQASIHDYQDGARKINETEIQYHDLAREAKSTEEKYLLYQQKEEEARISDALDRKRIVNAVVAESPTIPAFPVGPSRSLLLLLGVALASLTSIGMAFVADYKDLSIRTPHEDANNLGVPVLACLPLDEQSIEQSLIL